MNDSDIYTPSDSEDEYSENEKIFLRRSRKFSQNTEDSEEEVYGLQSSADESDVKEVNTYSDVEEFVGDDLPDVKAWGRDKNAYYSTDYVDQDYGGFDGKDAVAAEYEEQEARAIQKRLAEQLDDDDFSLDIFTRKLHSKESENEAEEIIKPDPTKLSKRQKLDLLQKESPEFFGLTEDFKEKMTEVNLRLAPLLHCFEDKLFKTLPALKYVKTKYNVIHNYCLNVAFYLLLKTRRIQVQFHPVLRRLYQYRQLLKQIEPIDEEVMDPQIDTILSQIMEGEKVELVGAVGKEDKETSKKRLKLLRKRKQTNAEMERELLQTVASKRKRNGDFTNSFLTEDAEEYYDGEGLEGPAEDVGRDNSANRENVDEAGKRAITYQMAKNRGLTPYRKKELRNPRVKHKMKYRKAKIRRKGQVREPKHEVQRYGGEISGIKASVSRSIKIK